LFNLRAHPLSICGILFEGAHQVIITKRIRRNPLHIN
jgi:hypothetical protein